MPLVLVHGLKMPQSSLRWPWPTRRRSASPPSSPSNPRQGKARRAQTRSPLMRVTAGKIPKWEFPKLRGPKRAYTPHIRARVFRTFRSRTNLWKSPHGPYFRFGIIISLEGPGAHRPPVRLRRADSHWLLVPAPRLPGPSL